MEKKCRCCGEYKNHNDFSKASSNSDGLQRWCKNCHLDYFRTHRVENSIYQKRYSESVNGKIAISRKIKKHRERHRDRVYARDTLNNRIKSKKIIKEPCVVCGLNDSEAHHDDYGKPIDVIWLCNKHHLEMHHKVQIENSRDTI